MVSRSWIRQVSNASRASAVGADDAVARIVFVCGESLLPMVVLSTINLVVICIGGNVGFLV
jgi:hypothetical protein